MRLLLAQGIDDPVFGAPVRFTAQAMTIGTPGLGAIGYMKM